MTEHATEVWRDSDGTVTVMNSTVVDNEPMMAALNEQHPEIASLLRWGAQVRRGGMFERDKFVTPERFYDVMRVAQDAAESDDVVSGVIETTEALAFNRIRIESYDEDEEDIWAQIMDDIDLEFRIREMWRELFCVSQFYVAMWWGTKTYKVSGRSKNGVKRKKIFRNMRVPTAISLLDPLKVVPVGNFMFNQEQLAWIATRREAEVIDELLHSTVQQDETIARLITGRYTPDRHEARRLALLGLDSSHLFLLDPKNTWRHTATRSQYRTFADIRMKSVFELLDLKHLLREMDRSMLLGGTNYIVLVKKGTDDKPAKQPELDALNAQIRTLAKVPVIVGDHRLSIEIITPQQDFTLQPEKYNVIDARITARLYQMFMTGNFSAGTGKDSSVDLARVVARGLESRRSMLTRSIEKQVLNEIYKRNPDITEKPQIGFSPNQIALDFDPAMHAFLLDLRDRREISRQTILEQIDLTEQDEALKREREEEQYDDIFHTLTALQDPEQQQGFTQDNAKMQSDLSLRNAEENLKLQQKYNPQPADNSGTSPSAKKPASTPVKKAAPKPKQDPKAAGRTGGRTSGGLRHGGGAAPGSGQGKPADPRRKPAN